jgi:ecotin
MIKKNLFLVLVISFLTFQNSEINAQQNTRENSIDISMFPKAKDGHKLVYIELEPINNETNFQIELYAGKIAEVDCNNYSLMGKFTETNLTGWGYTYFTFESNGHLRSTMMACPDAEKSEKFVISTSEFMGYNSKLPIVIYVPDSIAVKYKIWERQALEFDAIESLD